MSEYRITEAGKMMVELRRERDTARKERDEYKGLLERSEGRVKEIVDDKLIRERDAAEAVVRKHAEWLKGEMENAVYQATGIQSHGFTVKLKERYRILDKAATHLRERARKHGIETIT